MHSILEHLTFIQNSKYHLFVCLYTILHNHITNRMYEFIFVRIRNPRSYNNADRYSLLYTKLILNKRFECCCSLSTQRCSFHIYKNKSSVLEALPVPSEALLKIILAIFSNRSEPSLCSIFRCY